MSTTESQNRSPEGIDERSENDKELAIGRSAKRRRVTAACDECRGKKVKCDGNRPVCLPCSRKSELHPRCTWGLRKYRSSSERTEELVRLKERIEELENRQGQLSQSIAPIKDTDSQASPSQISPGQRRESNAMMGLLNDDRNSSSAISYSNSSATSFMNQIQNVIDRQRNSSPGATASTTQSNDVQSQTSTKSLSKQNSHLDYVLPPRQKADHLLSVYWRFAGDLYPYLDVDEVHTQYQRVWTGGSLGEDGPTFVCLLNVIFSIACLLDPAIIPSKRVDSADVFYQRTLELVDFEVIQHRSILTVQCYLLLGQYLQSTNDPQHCWVFVGLAIRIAQSLALDLPSTSLEAPTPQRRQLMRIVWHGCQLMDTTVSMTLGRPSMTNLRAMPVPFPNAHPEGSICSCYSKPYPTNVGKSASHFYTESLRLSEILSGALVALYNASQPAEPSDDAYSAYFGNLGASAVGNILEINGKLRSWAGQLPLYLIPKDNEIKTTRQRRETNILWLRYYHIRILLFRPVLSQVCSGCDIQKKSLEDGLSWKIAFQCSVSCVRTAVETVTFIDDAILDKTLEELDELLPAWWYSMFYIYTAGTILVAGRLHQSILDEVSGKAIDDAWQGVMRILKRFSSFSDHARRCASALSVLSERVPQHRLNQQQLRAQFPRYDAEAAKQQQQEQPQQQQMQHAHEGQRSHAVPGPGAANIAEHFPMGVNDGNVMRPAIMTPGVNCAHSWSFDDAYDVIADMDESSTDYLRDLHLFDISLNQLNYEDMSWLTSFPSQLSES